MRAIIFGTESSGYNLYKKIVGADVIAFTDNNKNKWGLNIDNVPIIKPTDMKKLDFDVIYIGSHAGTEIKRQLVNEIGIEASKVVDFYMGGGNRWQGCLFKGGGARNQPTKNPWVHS